MRAQRSEITAFLMAASMLLPVAVEAAQGITGKTVRIEPSRTVHDSLVVSGETVLVEGDVEGDLLVFGATVKVRGDIDGSAYIFAQSLDMEGRVAGNFHGFAQWTRISGNVEGSTYLFTQQLQLQPEAEIGRDMFLFADSATLEGGLGRNLNGFIGTMDLMGTVGGDVRTAQVPMRLHLGPAARIDGELRVKRREAPPGAEGEEASGPLTMDDGAVVAGGVHWDIVEPSEEGPSKYLSLGWYGKKILWLLASFLTGIVLLFTAPSLLRRQSRQAGTAFGIGLIVMIATPILALLVALTLVGIPLALLLLLLWFAALILAKVLAGGWLGSRLLDVNVEDRRRFALALLMGLAILYVAIHLPWVGWIVHLAALGMGMGLLLLRVRRRFSDHRAPAGAAA